MKHIFGIIFFSFSYLIFIILLNVLSPEDVEIIKQIPRFMGGASAIYFLFLSRSGFSKLMTLYSFLLSSWYLFVVNHVHVPDIAILVTICVCCSFIFSYCFISDEISLGKHLDQFFLIIILSRFFMSPEMTISFVLELLVLFGLHYREYQEQHKNRVLVYLTLLLLLSCFYIFYSGVIRDMNIVVVLVLAAAGAGGVQFMCLSKTERGQTFALKVYLINNVFLGFILRKEGETFPRITICFLVLILCFFISLLAVSQIKNESLYSVLSESKTTLRGMFFPVLYILDNLFLHDAYRLCITSLFIQILVLMLLKFILKKEDEDPDREGRMPPKE